MSDSSPAHKAPIPSLSALPTPQKRKDPVCGMMVDPEKAAAKVEHAGKAYYFCSKNCAECFSREPEKFAVAPGSAGMDHGPAPGEQESMRSPGAMAPRSADEKKVRDTCPMHPQIIRRGRGSCRICGMALEPMDVFAE